MKAGPASSPPPGGARRPALRLAGGSGSPGGGAAAAAAVAVLACAVAAAAGLPALQLLASLKSEKGPYGMQLARDGRRLFVANFASDEIAVLDVADSKARPLSVYAGPEPIDVALSPAEDKLFVANFRPGMITVASTDDWRTIDNIKVEGSPVALVLSPQGDRIFAVNWGRSRIGHVDVIDVETHELVRTVKVGIRPVAAAVSPDGSRVYVANGGSNSITRVEAESGRSQEFPSLENPDGLAVSPDGSRLYVAGANGSEVAMMDTSTMTEARRATVGAAPAAVAVHPAGWVMTVDKGSGTLSLLDADLAQATRVSVGRSPNDVVISRDGRLAFVSVERDNRVAVVRIQ